MSQRHMQSGEGTARGFYVYIVLGLGSRQMVYITKMPHILPSCR